MGPAASPSMVTLIALATWLATPAAGSLGGLGSFAIQKGVKVSKKAAMPKAPPKDDLPCDFMASDDEKAMLATRIDTLEAQAAKQSEALADVLRELRELTGEEVP